MNENISLRQNLKDCWVLVKTNYKVLLPATIFMSISAIAGEADNMVLSLLSLIASIILQTGFIKITLDILDNKKPEIKTIISQKDKFFRYLWMSILSILIVGGPIVLVSVIFLAGTFSTGDFSLMTLGFSAIIMSLVILITLFFIVPRLMFANIALVDNNEKAWQAIKTSFLITKGKKLQVIFLFFLIAFMNILGVILFFVGLLITIPISQLMISKYYRQISGKLMPVVEETPTEITPIENIPA